MSSITDIATLIQGSTVVSGIVANSDNKIWGTLESVPSNTSQNNRAAALIRPNKINISDGGIIKQNHSSDESTGDIEIMKLYILEGSSSIKFNLVGKRLPDAAGTARPDWKMKNIVLPIQPDPQPGVRNYTAEFVII